MQTYRQPSPLDLVAVHDLISYLQARDWSELEPSTARWRVFAGPVDERGDPVEIVIPRDLGVPDISRLVRMGLETLAAVEREPAETVASRVAYYSSDVLLAKNIETGEYNSITLRLAAQQTSELRELVAYGACSEKDARPNFLQKLSVTRAMDQHVRFGHTFSGSFGFTIQSPLIRGPILYVQEPLPVREGEPIADPITYAPFERRVMERIVRGLMSSREATDTEDVDSLVRNYGSGFNANMCTAIVRMGLNEKPVQYNVLWSPKMPPASDLAALTPILLQAKSYKVLTDAAAILRQLEPELTRIHGRVTHLVSKGAPRGESGIERSVVIQETAPPRGVRPRSIIVYLHREDYLRAIQAHEEWQSVEITGVLQRQGGSWRLSEPHNLIVLN